MPCKYDSALLQLMSLHSQALHVPPVCVTLWEQYCPLGKQLEGLNAQENIKLVMTGEQEHIAAN